MDVIVIGGGPSGLISSYQCSLNGHNVTLLEKNEKVGKKLYITGKGRCNVTNNCDEETFLKSVVTNSKFLYSSIYNFAPRDTINLIEENGCSLKTERGNRVFPVSDKSSDIIFALKNLTTKAGTKILLNQNVIDCYKDDNKFVVKTLDNTYYSDALILCTGGNSYKATGSDGYGYKLAKKFGHSITDLHSALCPIKLKDSWIKSIEGLPLKNVELFAYDDKNKLIKSEFGEMLFTSCGISGPIALTISSYINKYNSVKLSLDFKPALSTEKLENRLLREIEENKNAEFSTMLKHLLPKNFVPIFANRCNINLNKKLNSITVEDRKTIVNNLKNFNLNFLSLYDIDFGIVTSGGINVKEINPKTMESKFVKNLFFAGEVIDVDALTGGFNIQIALSTGISAGKGVL